MSLILHPISIQDANLLVKRWHRHHKPTLSALFAVGVAREGDEEPCGAAIIGRPVARMLQDGWTAEVVRLVTDGTPNACSMLYAAALTAALWKLLGPEKFLWARKWYGCWTLDSVERLLAEGGG